MTVFSILVIDRITLIEAFALGYAVRLIVHEGMGGGRAQSVRHRQTPRVAARPPPSKTALAVSAQRGYGERDVNAITWLEPSSICRRRRGHT
jgi:hypothetical protein